MLDKTKNVQVIPEVGMGATIHHYSDKEACTIVRITNAGKTIHVQKDIATINPNFKPAIDAGGFVGHCTNQDDQNYTYERNPEASIYVFSLRKNGKYVEAKSKNGSKLTIGERKEFYDYNY